MTSAVPIHDHAYAWVWLHGANEPVVAGRLDARNGTVTFSYCRSYLSRADRIPIYLPELPCEVDSLPLPAGLSIPGSIRDAAPDAWGRRVILNRNSDLKADEPAEVEFFELGVLLETGSDRIGGLDFQLSATEYVPRLPGSHASIEDLLAAAERVEKDLPPLPAFGGGLHHRVGVGGARPKALIEEGSAKYIAKFPSSTDANPVVKWEFVAMRLASLCGLDVAPVEMVEVSGKDALLVRRFDRFRDGGEWRRRMMVSALTILGLDELMARYASYQDLAGIVRHRFTNSADTLRELFSRIVFSILCGNTDDHARNHAAFWDGSELTLTPAFDICPQGRWGQEATQAMIIVDGDRMSRLSTCLAAAANFGLERMTAISIIQGQIRGISEHWKTVCAAAGLGEAARAAMLGRQFLNPFAFTALEGADDGLIVLAEKARALMA